MHDPTGVAFARVNATTDDNPCKFTEGFVADAGASTPQRSLTFTQRGGPGSFSRSMERNQLAHIPSFGATKLQNTTESQGNSQEPNNNVPNPPALDPRE
jgi:hypothetical protein